MIFWPRTLRFLLLAAGTVMASTTTAHADQFSLAYQRQPELAECPDEMAFRQLMATHLGRDPFGFEGAVVEVRFELDPSGERLSLHVNVEGQGGRDFEDVRSNCGALADAAASAIVLIIDPLGNDARTGPAVATPLNPVVPAPSTPPLVELAVRPIFFGGYVAARLNIGAPLPAGMGPEIGARLTGDGFQIDLGAGLVFPFQALATTGMETIQGRAAYGTARGCFRSNWWFSTLTIPLCLGIEAGVLTASGNNVETSGAYLAPSGRLELQVTHGGTDSAFDLGLYFEVAISAIKPTLTISSVTFSPPDFAFNGGLVTSLRWAL